VPLELRAPGAQPLTVLGLAAHPDDLEIGCGATVRRLLQRSGKTTMHWLVAAGSEARLDEARAAATQLLGPHQAGDLIVGGRFRDGFLPGAWTEVKDSIREQTVGIRPDLVLAPSRHDLHQDHRVMAELAWQLFRGATIWEYEIPKWDGDLGRPNLYVPLDQEDFDFKLQLLHSSFPSQADKPWFDDEVFRGLARLRGMEAGCRYAEAFTARKLTATFD
jgi:LmbE family N-acetylglucosaminyl deacetylase